MKEEKNNKVEISKIDKQEKSKNIVKDKSQVEYPKINFKHFFEKYL